MLVALVAAGGLNACVRVRAHERETLASPAMRAPAWPTVDRADEHTFAIREGTGGATSAGAGGCGCN
jgi:hypothetical protein